MPWESQGFTEYRTPTVMYHTLGSTANQPVEAVQNSEGI